MKSLLEQDAFNEIKDRLKHLEENSERQWGKMTPAQMARHCQYPLRIMLGHDDYNLKPNWLVNLLFKKSMYNDKLWRKNLPTVKRFKQIEPADFSKEISKLQSLIDEIGENRDRESWGDHPAFGNLTNEQWGKMQYKHLDHHLRQFGV
jgi:hypothetical protein